MIYEADDVTIATIATEPPGAPQNPLRNQQTSPITQAYRPEPIDPYPSLLPLSATQANMDIHHTSSPPALITRYDSDSDDSTTCTESSTLQVNSHTSATTPANEHSTTPGCTCRLTSIHDHGISSNCRHTTTTPLIPSQVITPNHPAPTIPIPGLAPIQRPGRTTQDNFGIGDTLQLPKPATSLRVYFQNINGINLTHQGNWDITCEHIRDMEIDIALLAEHKLDTNQPRVKK